MNEQREEDSGVEGSPGDAVDSHGEIFDEEDAQAQVDEGLGEGDHGAETDFV